MYPRPQESGWIEIGDVPVDDPQPLKNTGWSKIGDDHPAMDDYPPIAVP